MRLRAYVSAVGGREHLAINYTAEDAVMILRIDDVIASKSGLGGMGEEDFE